MKTKIKFMTNDEQFRRVMKILKLDFQEQYTYGQHYFIIHDKENLDTGWGGNAFKDCEYEEIDSDLFIRTNGTCEENPTDIVENFVIKALEEGNEYLKKKIENLHIALNKKVEKNKNQKEEITRLFKLNQQCKSGITRLVGYPIDDRMPLKDYIDSIIKNIEELKQKSTVNNLDMQIHLLEIMEFKNQLKEKDTIIKYLEDKLNDSKL